MNLPNKLTLARIGLIPLFVVAMMFPSPGMRVLATSLYLLASLTDLLDGRIARARGQITDFGKLMDPIADKLLVMAALVALVAQGRAHPACVMLILGREFVVSGIRLVAAGRGVVIAAGWIGKLKTTLQVIATVLLMLPDESWMHRPMLGIDGLGAWMYGAGGALLWISAVISMWSLVDYIVRNKEVIAP